MLPDLVPVYEEREASRFSGYTPTAWRDLPHEERAMCVAHYRVHKMVEMHKELAVINEMKRRSKS